MPDEVLVDSVHLRHAVLTHLLIQLPAEEIEVIPQFNPVVQITVNSSKMISNVCRDNFIIYSAAMGSTRSTILLDFTVNVNTTIEYTVDKLVILNAFTRPIETSDCMRLDESDMLKQKKFYFTIFPQIVSALNSFHSKNFVY